MKKTVLFLILFMLATGVSAQMSIPRHVYELDRIEEAMAKAAQGGKALSFVLTNPDTRCGLCVRTSEEAFSRLRSHSEVVLLRTGGQKYSHVITPVILQQFRAPEMGRIIPKAVVSTPDMGRVLGSLKYEDMKETRHFMSLAREIRQYTSGSETPPLPSGEMRWILKTDRLFHGSFVRLEGENLTLKIAESGNEVTRPLSDFAEGTVRMARIMASGGAAASLPPVASGTPLPIEVWTSSDGVRQIQARFISLRGNTLTLVNELGNTLEFDISLLNEDSQKLAQARAASLP